MDVPADQTDTVSLAALTADAARLLCTGQFHALAARYGYALAHGRDLAAGIRDDLAACLAELGAEALAQSDVPPVATIRYFKPGEHGLYAVGECRLPTAASGELLLELIFTGSATQLHACLEQVSAEV